MNALRLSRAATLTRIPGGVLLRSDLGTFQITGADLQTFVGELVPLLDGSRDREAVVAALPRYAPASVARFLDLLAQRGLLEDEAARADDARRRGALAFLARWPGSPVEALDRLAKARVLLAGDEPWGEAAARALHHAGVRAIARFTGRAADTDDSLVVAAVSSEDVAMTEHVAGLAHRVGVRALWSHLAGSRAVVGPLTVPGRTACPICARSEALGPRLSEAPRRGPRAALMAELLGQLVALQVLAVTMGHTQTNLGGRALVQDLDTFETTLVTLVRLPWCRVCGAHAA
jgi:hypothetical protein